MPNTVAIDRIYRRDWPVSLVDAKAHARIEHDEEDELIRAYLSAATEYAQNYTQRTFLITKYRQYFDAWPRRACIQHPPFRAITGVYYIDTDGVEQQLPFDNVDARPYNLIGEVELTGSLPTVATGLQKIAIEYVAGYGDYAAPHRAGFPYTFPIVFGIKRTAAWDAPDIGTPMIFDSEEHGQISKMAIEEPIRQAILLLTANFYENRDSSVLGNLKHEVPVTAHALLDQFRVYGL